MADNAELESFRREWREEVARRSKPRSRAAPPSAPAAAPAPPRLPPTAYEAIHRKELEEEGPPPGSFDPDDLARQVDDLSVKPGEREEEDEFTRQAQAEPNSALEHFERAVEKEAAGNLGDSLQHYRKAYRLDDAVDKTYRNKHFAHVWNKKPTAQPLPSDTAAVPVTVPAAASAETEVLPTSELIASFAHLPILPAEPLIEKTPPPPCPIANVPSEVLIVILRHVATRDPSTFARMALVCKQFAYHFAHEQHIWKQICQRPEFGFQGMHYDFACDVIGQPIYTLRGERYTPFPEGVALEIPKPLSSWSQVFQSYPRIRYTGIYISTVNYMRAGAASAFQNVSWNSPIHIVTYYRYLRFYPDGSVISLLTTTEPVDVVPHISKENMILARTTKRGAHQLQASTDPGKSFSGAADYVPPVAMNTLKYCLRGRWRLASPVATEDDEEQGLECAPGQEPAPFDPRDLVIETEGAASQYVYLMNLSLRSPNASKSHTNPSKNTKLVWRDFWSYNKITDDWAKFNLRNDRAFVFRRVRGWGLD
ncbi:hypothetical protein N7532_003710 [Penicillium argentinense]|uniref:F-box domain-containing protein n=1 Tax=Penicillium argentinense TaxID=1131581 RepID=A0A9W9FMY4_9EURO|nr:uncharacterized protein N7532_003710 [Penicillium argentinense]KAJ5103181.1 hypothetical protein N7532_003710 [Penicillium argentinense]